MRFQVGEVSVITPQRHVALATALAETAAPSRRWLGLGSIDPGPLVLAVAADRATLTRWSQGRVPGWGAGFAMPSARTIVIRADGGDPFGTLRHELAHIALHQRVKQRVPLWFSEGYAVLAAGEHGRMDALQLNLTVVSGRVPDLRGLDAALRAGASDAEAAYALAGSAVGELARRNPGRTLDPLLAQLAAGASFDAAVLATTGLTPGRFEEVWYKAVRHRYNWGIWLVTGGVWLLVALGLGGAAVWRRRFDAPRRAALDIGWPAPPDDEDDKTITVAGAPLDRSDTDR